MLQMVLLLSKSPILLRMASVFTMVHVLVTCLQYLSCSLTNYISMLSRTPPSLTRIFAVPSWRSKVLCQMRLPTQRSRLNDGQLSWTCVQNTVPFFAVHVVLRAMYHRGSSRPCPAWHTPCRSSPVYPLTPARPPSSINVSMPY